MSIKFGEKYDSKRPKLPGCTESYFTDMKKDEKGNIMLFDNDKEVGTVVGEKDAYILRVSNGESREIYGYYLNNSKSWEFKCSSNIDEKTHKDFARFFNNVRLFRNSVDTKRKANQSFSIGPVVKNMSLNK